MSETYIATATKTIDAPVAKVWQALTDPQLIRQYLFDTEVVSDWKVGSDIVYKGEWEGKPFEDKGKILELTPEKRFVSTHWSPLSGVPDLPENYHTVTYTLTEKGDQTEVTISQDNNASEDEKAHSEKNWSAALDGMQKLLEK